MTDLVKLARLFERGMSVRDAHDVTSVLSEEVVLRRIMIRALGVDTGRRVAAIIASGSVAQNSGELTRLFTRRFDVVSARSIVEELAGSYEGPLDIQPGAMLAVSASRALSAAWIGQNVIKLRRDSDNAVLDFVAGADGDVDQAAVATWLAGANGFAVTLYDQSGNGANVSQANAAKQCRWVPNAQNGHPALGGNAANSGNAELDNTTASLAWTSGGITMYWVGKRESQGPDISLASSGNGSIDLTLGAGGETAILLSDGNGNDAGGSFPNITTVGFHLVDLVSEFGNTEILLDGVALVEASSFDFGGPLGATDPLDQLLVRTSHTGSTNVERLCENITYPTVLGVSPRLAVAQNITTYYGITL